MSFSTLEQRFNQVSKQLYNRFSPSGDQYVSIKPDTKGVLGSESRVKNDSRSVPTVSTARDIRRLTRFTNSPEGRLFIGKQFLLQTGNTFAETRLYNPANILINAVPFIGRGTTRHAGKPFGIRTLKTPTRDFRGALQDETLNKFDVGGAGNGLLGQLKTAVISPFKAYGYQPKLTEYFTDQAKEYYLRPEDRAFYSQPINLTWRREGNFSAYIHRGRIDTDLGAQLFQVQPLGSRGNVKKERNSVTTFVQQFIKFGIQRPQPFVRGSKTFKELENTLNTNGYFLGKLLDTQNLSPDVNNAEIAAQNIPDTQIKYPTILDPYNGITGEALDPISSNEDGTPFEGTPVRGDPLANTSLYKNIIGDPKNNPIYTNVDKTDIIKFIFSTAEPDAQPVHFRAFLSSLKQNVKPEFNEQRYIGRTERFVTYGGARRTANFEFTVAAFSQNEIQQVWARINYLTGLAFPRGVSSSGFMIPPLFRLTIGNIYNDQPCYIDNLDYDFIDAETTTFDIDNEVSQWVKVTMNVILLEKRSRFYDSPFYAITEQQLAR
jgi:hypothetical protein